MPLARQMQEIIFQGSTNAQEHAEAQGPQQFRDSDGFRFGEIGRLERTPATANTYTLTPPTGGNWTSNEAATTLIRRGGEVAAMTQHNGVARLIGTSTVDWCRRRRTATSSPDYVLTNAPANVEVSRRIVASAQFSTGSQWIWGATSCRTESGDLLIAWIEAATSGNFRLFIRVYSLTTGQIVSSTTETVLLAGTFYTLRACRYGESGSTGAIVTICDGTGVAPYTITAYRYDDTTREVVTGGTLTTNAKTYVHEVMYNQDSPNGFHFAFMDNTTGFLTVQTRTISTVASTHAGTHASNDFALVQGSSSVFVFSSTGGTLYAEVLGTPAGVQTITTAGGGETFFGLTACVDTYTGYTAVATAWVTVLDTNVSTTRKTIVSTVEFDGTISAIATNTHQNCFPATGAWYYSGRAHVVMSDGFLASKSGIVVRTANGGRVEPVARVIHDRLYVLPGSLAYAAPPSVYCTSAGVAHVVTLGDVSADKVTTSPMLAPQTLFWAQVDHGTQRPLSWVEHDGTTLVAAGQLVDYDGVLCSEAQPMWAPYIYSAGGGAISARAIYRWVDAAGKLHVSAVSNTITDHAAAGTIYVSKPPFFAYDGSTAQEVSVELYVTDGSTSTYYLAASSNAKEDYTSTSTGGQWWVFTTIAAGSSSDPTIYTTGGVLESEAPPSFAAITRVGDRLFAVDAEDRQRFWFSKPFEAGYAPQWNTANTGRCPDDIVGIANMQGAAAFLCANGVWAISGEGPNNLGQGTFGPPQKVSELGCVSRRSVCETPYGVAYLSRSGYALVSGGAPQLFGTPVVNYLNGRQVDTTGTSRPVLRALYDQERDELRVLSSTYTHFFRFGEGGGWTRLSTTDLDVCISSTGVVHRALGATVYTEKRDTDSGFTSRVGSSTWETPWFKFDGISGFGRLWSLILTLSAPSEVASLGSDTGITLRLYVDFDGSAVNTTWTIPGSEIATWTASKARPIALVPNTQRITAFKLTSTESFVTAHSGFIPLSLSVEAGVEPNRRRYQKAATSA